MTEVTVLSKKPCVQCDATMKTLDRFKQDYKVEDIYDEKNLALVEELGYKQAPVVLVHVDGELVNHWSGFNPGELDKFK